MTKVAVGFRELKPEEWELIAGGTITVDGYPPTYDDPTPGELYDPSWYDSGDMGGGGGGSPDPATDEGELTEEQEKAIEEGMKALKATLEELVKKNGDFKLTLPNGASYMASDLIKGAGKVSNAFAVLEGLELANGLANGDPDIGAILGFIGGMAAGAAVGAVGAGPLAVFAAGLAISVGAEYGYNQVANTVDAQVTAFFTNYNNQMQQANPDYNSLPSSVQESIFLEQLFGIPTPSGGGSGTGGGSGGSGGGNEQLN